MLFGISFSYLFRQDDNFNYMFLCMFSNLVLFSNCYFGIQYDKYIVPYQFTKLLVKSNVLFRFFLVESVLFIFFVSGVVLCFVVCFSCFLVESNLLIFLVLCVVLCFCVLFVFALCRLYLMLPVSLGCLRPVSSVPNVASVSVLCSPCVVCT